MINVLHLVPEMNITCGVHRCIYSIVSELSAEFQHHLITCGGDAELNIMSRYCKVTKYNRKPNKLLNIAIILVRLLQYCLMNDIKVINSHHRRFDTLAFVLSKLIKVRTITTVHSKVYSKKLISYKAQHLIAVSNTIRNHLITNYNVPDSKIEVINNFINPRKIILHSDPSTLKQTLGLGEEEIIVSFIGRFDRMEKGIDLLLEAFFRINRKKPEVHLLMVGNGLDETYIKSTLHNGIKCVTLIPPQVEIYDYYNISDIVVLPSRIDPFPFVTLESGIMRRAFIGSNVDGIAEVIEHEVNGLLFESNNADDLEIQMNKLLNDKELRKKLGDQLYSKVINLFTANKISNKYKVLYKIRNDST